MLAASALAVTIPAMNITDALNLMRRLESLPAIYEAADLAVIGTVKAYYAELFETELRDQARYAAGTDDRAAMRQSIEDKRAVHSKYWSNPALFYQPCSTSSDPSHDWSRISDIQVFRNEDDDNRMFIFAARYRMSERTQVNHVYVLRQVEDALKIEHSFM